MKVTVSFNRLKKNDKITEIISWSPDHSYLKDSSRLANHLIWIISTKKSISNRYKLLEQNHTESKIVNILEYNNLYETPKLSENYSFNYYPVLDKKTCIKCMHYRNKSKEYCYLKSKILNKNDWYKCSYWEEK